MNSGTRENVCLGAAGLAEGTNANTYQVANITHYVISGRAYRKAVTDNIAMAAFTGTSFTALAAKQTCAFFVMADTSGNLSLIQSAIVPSSAGTSYEKGAWEWPNKPDYACIGAIVIRTDNAATFTATSTDFGASDVVDTFHNVALDYGVPITY